MAKARKKLRSTSAARTEESLDDVLLRMRGDEDAQRALWLEVVTHHAKALAANQSLSPAVRKKARAVAAGLREVKALNERQSGLRQMSFLVGSTLSGTDPEQVRNRIVNEFRRQASELNDDGGLSAFRAGVEFATIALGQQASVAERLPGFIMWRGHAACLTPHEAAMLNAMAREDRVEWMKVHRAVWPNKPLDIQNLRMTQSRVNRALRKAQIPATLRVRKADLVVEFDPEI